MAAIAPLAPSIPNGTSSTAESAAPQAKAVKASMATEIPTDRPVGQIQAKAAALTLNSEKPQGPQNEKMTGLKYEPIVQKLVDWLNEKDLMDDLEESIEKVLSYNISVYRHLKIDSAKSFLDYCNSLLRWIPSEDTSGKDVYYHLVCFYFVFNTNPIGKKQTAIKPKNYGKLSWLSQWLVDYAIDMGEWLDQPESLTKKSLKSFWKSPLYKMDNYIEPRGGWKSFNQFFARNFKPGYRTIYSLNDDSVIVAPADCTFGGFYPVESNSTVTIKHLTWSIHELLQGSDYAAEFQGGLFTHSFLNTFDYHRLHTPVGGRVLESRVIQGQCYLETKVVKGKEIDEDNELVAFRSVDAPDSPGYQFVQTRGLIVMDSPIGLVAVLPMGMAQVSSVIMTAEEGVSLRKGEEIGFFQFGGSDIVVVYQAKARVALTAVKGIHVSMGMPIGTGKVQQ